MERIGWWFLRHSKPQRTYLCGLCHAVILPKDKKCRGCGAKIIKEKYIKTM
jgi:hypothetical protein